MGGSGGPSPKGKQIPEAKVISKDDSDGEVTFFMNIEDAAYFEVGTTYKLIAVEK